MKRAAIVVACLLAGVALLGVLEWDRLGDAMDRRAIATLRELTGDQTQIASIQFHWRDRSLDLNGIVVHGNEAAGALPVFSAPHVHLRVPFAALFGRTSHISELDIDSPQIRIGSDVHQILTPDDLRRMQIDRLRVHDGVLQAVSGWKAMPGRRIPVNIDAAGVQLTMRKHAKSYAIDCTAANFRIAVNRTYSTEGALTLAADVNGTSIAIARASLESKRSRVTAEGTIETVPGIQGAFTFHSHMDATALQSDEFRTGVIDSDGAIRIGNDGSWQASGSASGQNISLQASGYLRQPFTFQTSFLASETGLRLTGLRGSEALGSFRGAAEVKHWTEITAFGSVQNIDIQRILKHWAPSSHWTGIAAGVVRLSATLDSAKSDARVDVDVHISPGQKGIPIAGALSGSYSGRTNTVRIDHLELSSAGLQLTCSGTAAALTIHLRSGNALDLNPLLLAVTGRGLSAFETNLAGTAVEFDGMVANGHINGALLLHHFTTGRITWNQIRAAADVDPGELRITSAKLSSSDVQASLAGAVTLQNWLFDSAAAHAEVAGTVAVANVHDLYPAYSNAASATEMTAQFRLAGAVRDPAGKIAIILNRPEILGQQFGEGTATLGLSRGTVTIATAKLNSGHSRIDISGAFLHPSGKFANGQLKVRLETIGFPLATRTFIPVTGTVSARAAATLDVNDFIPRVTALTGTLTAPELHIADTSYTNVALSAKDDGQHIDADAAARFAGEPLQASLQLDPEHGFAMHASVSANRLDLQTIARAVRIEMPDVTATVAGNAVVDGALGNAREWHAKVTLTDIALQRTLADSSISLHSTRPAKLEIANGTAHISDLVMSSPDGELSTHGDIALISGYPMHLAVAGNISLQAFEMFDPNVLSSGEAIIQAALTGTIDRPLVNGTMAIRNGSLALKDLQTGITAVQAQIQFNRNRATIASLTGESGGGRIDVDGFITYGEGRPLTYNVKAAAHDMRYRYANAIGITGDSTLRLTGTTANGLLSGDVRLSRVVVSPEMDLGAVLSSTAAARQSGIERRSLLSGLQLDIHVASEPNLQVSTAIARGVEAAVDLRLRGTPDHPLVFGGITANEGDLRIFGAKYSINRCQITFANATRVEPIVDLDLETQSRGIAVDITIAGALDKLSMTYRSDPPLQPRDIIALLTVGKPPSFDPSASVQSGTGDFRPLQAGANTVLGQAIAPRSNGLSKLFGITNIKIDPLVQGLTNTPQSRLTIEQQISKNVTVTYVTNLAQTSEQIFRFEWSLNPQYSVVAVRDDNGEFGIDVQYKKRFH